MSDQQARELLTALKIVMNYVGGSDERQGHPCRVGFDAISRAEALGLSADQYEIAARAEGWTHGGDGDGIIYNVEQYDSWKEAASWAGDGGPNDNGPVYDSWQECCEAEGIEV